MYQNIEEILEDLDKMLEYIEDININDDYHIVLELGYQFREELQANVE